MTSKHVLIIDDEPDICELIEITLMRMGLKTRSAQNLTDARTLLESEAFDLCLTDMRLPDGDGIELVAHVQKNYPNLPIAVITAHGNMESAVKALKAGAFDFVSKPVDIQILRNLVSAATTLPDNKNEPGEKKTHITGNSIAIKELLNQIAKLARSQAPVFIHGESGSGKERAARMIHEQGARASAAFIPVNCGAIPAELMESEFFGHVKGSFTGATADKQGLFQAANDGTLFLDEVAELPLHMQVKLLRSIQEKAIRPVGAAYEIPVDVRILSASHKNLVEHVKKGQFREDLYYRINVIELSVPGLRDRTEDIPLLAAEILQNLSKKAGLSEPPKLDKKAIDALVDYPFPGNVRELENILERALALVEKDTIHREDLQLNQSTQSSPTTDNASADMDLAGREKTTILQALDKTRWNKTAAAKLLGLSLRQLRYRLEKLNIE
jgi:two-component system response regulator PilR (NtrC family)